MIVPHKNFIRRFALGLSLMATCSALAEDPRWYRVELLVFSHQSGSAASSEQWNPTPTLGYPDTGRFLVDSKRVADNLALYDATSVMDDLGHQTLTIIPPPMDIEDGAEELEPIATLKSERPLNVDPNEPTLSPEVLPTTPSPFVQLANAELEFRGKAAYMQRSGRYKTLFHETWVQPMIENEELLPIIVDRSGDTQDWPVLQGSIKFHLSRYLHLETNLWLNTNGNYLPQDWNMPEAPLGPKSLTIVYPPEPEPELKPEPDLATKTIETGFSILEGEGEIDDENLEPLGPVSPWRHAILLREKRRMRSTEVHYIDHPMLGIVVKITPVPEDELQERATAEHALVQAQAAALSR